MEQVGRDPLLNHHLMRQHCLLLEQRFVLENRFRARHYNAYLESSHDRTYTTS